MFSVRRGLSFTLVVGAAAVFACSSGLPDEDPQAQAGNAGRAGNAAKAGAGNAGTSDQEDAGASNGGNGRGGSGSNEAGADSGAGEGGADSGEPDGSEGGKANANGGARNTGGAAGKGHGGSAGSKGGASPGRGGSGGGLFTFTPPSAECEAAPAVPLDPISPVDGLDDPPSTGHPCDASTGYEPNDSEGQACRLVLGERISTQLSAATDKTDNFVFHAEADVSYALLVRALDCVGYNYVSVHVKTLGGAMGNIDQVSHDLRYGTQNAYPILTHTSGDELVTLTTPQSCQYTVEVVQSTARGLIQGFDSEPNDIASIATEIEVNQPVQSRLSGPGDTTDYFALPVQANLRYSLHVDMHNCVGYNFIRLTGLSTGSSAANLAGTDLQFGGVYDKEFVTATSGSELLSFETAQSCEYEFYVIPSTVCGLSHNQYFEPNNTASSAAPVALDQPVAADILQPADKVDYYTIPVEPKTKYTLSLSTAGCTGYKFLTVHAFSGTETYENGSKDFVFGSAAAPLSFTTGNATQELLKIESPASCAYDFTVSKG